jgi:plastocyanin
VSRVAAFAFAVAVLALGSGRAASALDAPGAATSVEGTVVVKVAPSSQGAVVTLEAPGKKGPPPAAITVDQQRLQFLPHLSVVPLGSTVRFLNSDKEPHNVYSPEGRYKPRRLGAGRRARAHVRAGRRLHPALQPPPRHAGLRRGGRHAIFRGHRREGRLRRARRAAWQVQAVGLAREERRPRARGRGGRGQAAKLELVLAK